MSSYRNGGTSTSRCAPGRAHPAPPMGDREGRPYVHVSRRRATTGGRPYEDCGRLSAPCLPVGRVAPTSMSADGGRPRGSPLRGWRALVRVHDAEEAVLAARWPHATQPPGCVSRPARPGGFASRSGESRPAPAGDREGRPYVHVSRRRATTGRRPYEGCGRLSASTMRRKRWLPTLAPRRPTPRLCVPPGPPRRLRLALRGEPTPRPQWATARVAPTSMSADGGRPRGVAPTRVAGACPCPRCGGSGACRRG